jgi:hypothetical protein
MSDRDLDGERRLRRAATARHGVVPGTDQPGETGGPADKAHEDDNAAAERMEQKALWVDLQVRRAIDRGEFADLPGAGKPLDLPDQHDPDWWVKRLIEREKITGVAPPAISLRQEDAELDATLDREWSPDGVRRVVEDFNRRVVEARRQLTGGPPVVTRLRDTDSEVDRWRERRAAAQEAARQRAAEASRRADSERRGRRWWSRRSS